MGQYEKYLNVREDLPKLKRFAFCGTGIAFDRKLHWLEKHIEPEKWRFKKGNGEELYVLFYYVVHTFDQCFEQEKISINKEETVAAFNTGLMTSTGEELFGIFTKSETYQPENPSSNYWYLRKFLKSSDREFMSLGLGTPEMATYFKNYNELYFDPELDIQISIDHIYDDNYDRLPDDLKKFEKPVVSAMIKGAIEYSKKKIKRNSRIAVPQYYRGKIMFLVPLDLFGDQPTVLALEKEQTQYRANTVLTLEFAYNCARLLTKPESNWLLPR